MARKRKAEESGRTASGRASGRRKTSSADVAEPSDAGKSGSAMSSTNTRPKRNPRRVVKDKWEEEKLMTSEKSQLVELDLVRLLAHPEAWSCLEKEEREEIISLLPDHAHPNPHHPLDGPEGNVPPPPESFLRYSNHWRDGIRQFQLDLENGRYDPQWLLQADEAKRERAAGKFDKFKEKEYEEFWGQKQTFDKSIAAGESSQVKLETLIQNGLVREGDIWKFSRSFNNGNDKILVEKEARIVGIDGSRLTFAVPPGQRVFLPHGQTSPQKPTQVAKQEADGAAEGISAPTMDADGETENTPSKKRKAGPGRGRPRKKQPEPEVEESTIIENHESPAQESTNTGFAVELNNHNSTASTEEAKEIDQPEVDATHIVPETIKEKTPSPSPPPSDGSDEIILPNITGPSALAMKIILEVDGRIQHVPNGNAWKEFRSYRNNQDMGSLWEVRQAWFIRKCPS